MKKLLITICTCLIASTIYCEQANAQVKWTTSSETMPGNIKAFQENKGQFINNVNDWKVLYGCDYHGTRTLFTDHGVIYIIPEKVKTAFNDADNKSREEQEKENTKMVLHSVAIEWENVNSNSTVEPIDITPYYFGSTDPVNPGKSIDNIKGYKKLVFHNVQPGIDIEYTFHPTTGLKYSVTVHPGYNTNSFKMHYSGQTGLSLDESGHLHIVTPVGDIIDHAPVSSQNGANIESSFIKLTQNEIAFNVKTANSKTEVIIDPWTVSPIIAGFLPSDVVMDSTNNTYIYGEDTGATGYFVQKYTTSGALSWTYSLTPYGTFSGYVSALAVDPSGNTYIPGPYPYTNTVGGCYSLISLNTYGILRYFNDTSTLVQPYIFEVWSLVYSSKYAALIEAGAPTVEEQQVAIIDSNKGNFGKYTMNAAYGEIYTGCIAPNGNYYGISSNPCFGCNTPGNDIVCYTVIAGTPSFAWNNQSTYEWNDFDNKNPNGIATNGIAASPAYLYTSDGLSLNQRSLTNGNSLKAVTIPAGSNVVGSSPSGIAVDEFCGNVYVGTLNAVQIYDPSLNTLSSQTMPGPVYGVTCNNGLVTACGGQVGKGFVIQFAASNSPCDSFPLSVQGVATIKPTIEVYPNPSSGLFNIKTSYDNNTLVEVYNSLGQFITQKRILNGRAVLDLSAEANGIYCLRVLNNNTSDHFNIIVSH